MEVLEVDAVDYDKHLAEPLSIFNSAKFAELNKEKVDSIHYLLFKDSKIRLGLILGVLGSEVKSPFSAPFGGFSFINQETKASVLIEALTAFEKWLADHSYRKIAFVLPPLWYATGFLTRITNSLFVKGYRNEQIDVNHQFEVPDNFEAHYPNMLHRNAKKNLNSALKQKLNWVQLSHKDTSRSYEVIAMNRAERQKPLRMSLDHVIKTAQLIPTDFFVVEHYDEDVAAAIVFNIAPKVVQVIYWGDIPKYHELRAMNFLTYQLFQHYAKKSIKVIDIGISTENSIPNYGLCEFKESIGCSVSLKFTFTKEINVYY